MGSHVAPSRMNGSADVSTQTHVVVIKAISQQQSRLAPTVQNS